MKKHFTSKLAEITDAVFSATDFLSAQSLFISFVDGTQVKDKNKMISEVKGMRTLPQLQRYTANALLKFEGLGVVRAK
jgi:hypothetical protein